MLLSSEEVADNGGGGETNSDRDEEGADPRLENKPNTAISGRTLSFINRRSFHTSPASSAPSSSSSFSRSSSPPRRREQRRQSVPAAGQIHAIKPNGRCPRISHIPFHEIQLAFCSNSRVENSRANSAFPDKRHMDMQALVCHMIDNRLVINLPMSTRARGRA